MTDPEKLNDAHLEDVKAPRRRLGFLKGEFSVPDDFNEMGREEIEAMFYGTDADKPA